MGLFKGVSRVCILFFCLLAVVSPVFAISEEEMAFLRMYFKDEELVILSTTRSLKSITRVAENVEVVTHEDIELMNAHTLADVLQKVNGVQVDMRGGVGAFAFVFIQGSDFRHVAVFMDGVPMQLFSDNIADIAAIPVQQLEKVEIIKGPASSVWGSSLGGVINLITKSGGDQKRQGATVSAAYGERTAVDLRAEVSGRKDKIGYYFYAGKMQSSGFRGLPTNSGNSSDNYYLKLSQELSTDNELMLSAYYSRGYRGEGFPELDWLDNKKYENMYAVLTLNSSLNKDTKLSISARTASRDWDYRGYDIISDSLYTLFHSRDDAYGASAKLTARLGAHDLVAGIDYDDGNNHLTDSLWGMEQRSSRGNLAFYANDTITLGKFSVTPGIRFDKDNIVGDFISPSLGLTYQAAEKTLLRATVSRGFNAAPPGWASDNIAYGYKGNPDLTSEKVWSYQFGVETAAMEYLWLKASAFRHDISDAIIDRMIESDPVFFVTEVNANKIRHEGVELAARTSPFKHLTLSAGATLMRMKNRTTGETVHDSPKSSYDIGLKYDDETLKALLTCHYVDWDGTFEERKYGSPIVDFNVIWRFYKKESGGAEVFGTAHNMFDADSNLSKNYRYPDRWVEAGLRYKF